MPFTVSGIDWLETALTIRPVDFVPSGSRRTVWKPGMHGGAAPDDDLEAARLSSELASPWAPRPEMISASLGSATRQTVRKAMTSTSTRDDGRDDDVEHGVVLPLEVRAYDGQRRAGET